MEFFLSQNFVTCAINCIGVLKGSMLGNLEFKICIRKSKKV